MDVAIPGIGDDVAPPGLAGHYLRQKLVGKEEYWAVSGHGSHHLGGVGGSAAVITLRFDRRGSIDVCNHHRVGKSRFPGAQFIGGDRRGQRAARTQVGKQHGFLGTQNRRRFGHKVHAAKNDKRGAGRSRFLAQAQRISREVSDLLHLGALVMVRQHDGVALPAKLPDFLLFLANLFRGVINLFNRRKRVS